MAQEQEEEKAALSIKIDRIIYNNFPDMTVHTIVENDKGEVMTGLSPGLFKFRIDAMEADIKAKITPFSMKELAIDYSIIFSNNGIMEGEPLDFQKNAILQFIDSMKESDRLSLYTIGEEATAIFEEQGKESIDPSTVNTIEVNVAQPRVYDSIINVLRKVQRRRIERKVLIIISDGRDQNSRFTKEQLNTVISEVDVPVYALGFRVLNSQSLSYLNEMADLTGGTYLYVSRVAAIPESLKQLTGIITQPYIIELKIRKMKADDLPHILEVSINERDMMGKGQKTFTAIKVPIPRWVRWVILAGVALIIIIFIVLSVMFRIKKRKKMGITRRRCPDCHNRMKDSWDSCPFCRYLPNIKKKKKLKGKKKKDA
jgi:hypothetical protein